MQDVKTDISLPWEVRDVDGERRLVMFSVNGSVAAEFRVVDGIMYRRMLRADLTLFEDSKWEWITDWEMRYIAKHNFPTYQFFREQTTGFRRLSRGL